MTQFRANNITHSTSQRAYFSFLHSQCLAQNLALSGHPITQEIFVECLSEVLTKLYNCSYAILCVCTSQANFLMNFTVSQYFKLDSKCKAPTGSLSNLLTLYLWRIFKIFIVALKISKTFTYSRILLFKMHWQLSSSRKLFLNNSTKHS